jgi:hypothetical protein
MSCVASARCTSVAVRPVLPKTHQGPPHGGDEDPGTPESSPSTHRPDYAGLGATQPAIVPAMQSLKRLVRGVY